MALDNANYISQLNPNNPLPDDLVSEGDDHLRNTKLAIKQTFPGSGGAGYAKPIVATEDELNNLTGLDTNIISKLDLKANLESPILTGTPIAPTAAEDDNSTQIATTAYVDSPSVSPTAWVSFSGDGADSSPCTILDSYNVSGVSKQVGGNYSIVFATPTTNANYIVSGTTQPTLAGASSILSVGIARNTNPTTTGFAIKTIGDVSNEQAKTVSLLIFGGK